MKRSKELSYVIGAFYSDGWIGKQGRHYRLHLKVKDKDFIEEFNRCVCDVLGKKELYSVYPCDGLYRLTVTRKSVYKYFDRDLEFHRKVIEKYPSNFLRGFYDGDGGAASNSVCVYVANTNRALLGYIKTLLDSYFSIPSGKIRVGTRKGTEYSIGKWKGTANKTVYRFTINKVSGAKKFLHKIGFSIRRKEKALKASLKAKKH